MKWVSRLFLLTMLGALTNCAAIVTGTDQEIEVTTQPAGATCQLSQGNERVSTIPSTPRTVSVDRSWSDLYITCEKKGHLPETVMVPSELEPVTFGNILIGGIIGFSVDAATGSMREYPDEQFFVLVPGEFSSAQDAHDYFNELSELVIRREMIKEGKLKRTCLNWGDDVPECQVQEEDMSDALWKKLEKVEDKRLLALDRLTGRDKSLAGGLKQKGNMPDNHPVREEIPSSSKAASKPVNPYYQPFLI
ncbi:hypothetical protein [Aestuariispira insulae]|uniref:PEGA domain-containing protein n=1 Tax=Aestuariispira insulae TaxID=1461337 RepID=A0A3D9HPQ6_9PROT|nr:hypothetical protein [Aestuariispira insulae]RED51385.1 hypothetical protein DFP90_103185 [Aestuariispira insulae]